MLINNENSFPCEKDAFALLEATMGFLWQAALRSAAILGVADQLTTEDKTAEQLAEALNVDSGRLRRMMRMLASRGLFHYANDRFSLTPMAELLCTDHPWSLRNAILMLTDQTMWLPALDLSDTVRGGDAFQDRFGCGFYDYWSQQDSRSDETLFNSGMYAMSRVENEVLVRSYDFPHHATVVDIAGGYGNLLLNILRHNPTLKGILFDREEVLSGNILHQLGDNSRWSLKPGNFFASCPAADIYLLKYIIMDWSDSKATEILRNCRAAMPEHAKILLLEPCMHEERNKAGSYALDVLLMSSFAGGQIRTPQALDTLFSAAGLKRNRVIDTHTYLSIIEAVAA